MANLFYTKKRNAKALFLILFFILFLFIFYIFNINKKNGSSEMTKEFDKNLPVWNLDDLYLGINDININKDLDDIENRVKNFNSYYLNSVSLLDGYKLYKAFLEYEGISESMSKIMSFAYLKYAENLSIEDNVIFYQKMSEKINLLVSDLIFFDLEINKMSDEEINEKFNESSNLKKYYGRYIENLRKYKNHQLSLDLEKLMNEKSITSRESWSRFFDQTIDNMVFEFDGKKMNEAQILEIVNGKDTKKRKEAGKVFGEKLGENIKTFAFITNVLAKDKSISDEWRGYKTPISSRNLSNMIEDSVVENLYNSVKDNYKNISHRYYKIKSKIMGLDNLHYTDRNAPLPFDNDRVYTWDEAKNIVLNAYMNFSPEMAEIGKKFFDNNWIDVPTRAGKRGGAFAHQSIPSVHPYLLLNFQGKTRDVMTLAHELGHGIHMYLSKDKGYFMSNTPLTLSETASVFGEQLVFRYLLNNENDKNKKISIIANKIEDMINTVIRQIAFLEFEKIVHEERKNGELSVNRLNEIWLNVQKESLGDNFIFEDEYKYYWSYIPHFIHSPFYVYSYAFGDCLVNSLYVNYLENSDGFVNEYINLLKAGGSEDYKNLLKSFDLDPLDPDFWQNGMDLIVDLINELEVLLENV